MTTSDVVDFPHKISSIKEKLTTMAIIITDCTGIKFDAIESFRRELNYIECRHIEVGGNFETPLSRRSLIETLKARMNLLRKESGAIGDAILITGQRNYEYDGILYHLSGGISVQFPSGPILRAFTSTVPLDEKISAEKRADRKKNISDLLKAKHINWKGGSVFELLTKEPEKGWWQEPLRYCFKQAH